MRRAVLPALALAGLASPLAGASVVHRTPGNRARHAAPPAARPRTPASPGTRGPVRLWLAGRVTYRWSGNDCATPAAPSPSAPATAPCHETFTNVVTASASDRTGRLLAPLPGEQLTFTWYGDVFTPMTAGQARCTIIDTGTGTETIGANGSSSTVRYTSYALRSPDCTIDTTNGPPASESLEATGSCLSCSFSGYLGEPVVVRFSAPGYRVLDDDFPVNTNTI